MLELGEVLAAIRAAYGDGAAAAQSGRPLSSVPTFSVPDARQAWLNGWFDAAVFLRLIPDGETTNSLIGADSSKVRNGQSTFEGLAA